MNLVVLTGRLTADPEVRHTNDDKMVASYTIAVDRPAARAESKSDFIRCVAWEKKAEFAEHYMRKGRKFAVSGRIQTGSYKDKDGRTVYTTDVIVDRQEFADSKPDAEREGQAQGNDFMSIPDGADTELPFN